MEWTLAEVQIIPSVDIKYGLFSINYLTKEPNFGLFGLDERCHGFHVYIVFKLKGFEDRLSFFLCSEF